MDRIFSLALALLSTGELPYAREVLVDRVDVIELNHVHSPDHGGQVLAQVIYWRWNSEHSRFNVCAWRLLDGSGVRPARFRRDGREWIETREDGPARRMIIAPRLVETWTLHDPEVADRELLPVSLRRGLRQTPAEK